ncbi:TRAP transporter small permease [Shimia biformata]|uniref:TRAP transporter small permease n=1 Tax=Shimia biformata TaxID=1294299 RepID=UPI0019525F9F|nr:TRAP transporter small permease [Shimia biformata]
MSNSRLNQLVAAANWISKPTALIGILALLGIAILTIANVLGRWLLNQPLIGIHDLFGLAIVIVVAACFPTGVMQRRHVSIKFLGLALGPKATRVLDSVAALVLAVFLAIIAWQVTVEAIEKTSSGEYTLVLKLLTGPVWWAASLILWISVPMQLVVFADIATRVDPQPTKDF